MKAILTADVGSTFTKLTAVDIRSRSVICCARAFTTIGTNVMDGFNAALKELTARCGPLDFEKRLASSSAAGGLKMIAVGLAPELTVQAARQAAANAGAKLLKTYAYELSKSELAEIKAFGPDMLLLSGGIDGGNRDVIIHNARMLARYGPACSLVVAGNKSAVDDLRSVLKDYPGETLFCANVMPEINQLNIEPARKAIRDLFIKNIIAAKGLDELQKTLAAEIIPTPLAVFEAAGLLSKGTGACRGLGELMVFDVGGATTDVCSMSEGLPTRSNVFLRGFRQPFAKRTVEGDLGLRYSLSSLAEAAGPEEAAARCGVAESEVESWLSVCRADPGVLPEPSSVGRLIDGEMAAMAVNISMKRHCGFLEPVYTLAGRSWAQTGKDLTNVRYVIGTGGPIINAADPDRILGEAVRQPADLDLLKPVEPRLRVDRKYILSAMGLLARVEPETALHIMMTELAPAPDAQER